MSAGELEGRDPRPAGRGVLGMLARAVAGSLAVAAILLTVWEGLENRHHNRLSVQPRIDGSSAVSNAEGLWTQSFRFASAGLGPGVVTEFRVYWHAREIWNGRSAGSSSGPWQPILDELSDRFDLTATALAVGSVLRVGQDYDVVVARQRAAGSITDLLDATGTLGVLLCYCSLYDDQCRATSIGPSPRGPSTCAADGLLEDSR